METHRRERLTEALREELAELIGYEMEDPRLDGVEVLNVEVSPDGKKARVQVTGKPEAITALENAKVFIKNELSLRIDVFRIPEMRFEANPTFTNPERLAKLMKRVKKLRPRDAKNPL
jgi:ribosome-binding factor A